MQKSAQAVREAISITPASVCPAAKLFSAVRAEARAPMTDVFMKSRLLDRLF